MLSQWEPKYKGVLSNWARKHHASKKYAEIQVRKFFTDDHQHYSNIFHEHNVPTFVVVLDGDDIDDIRKRPMNTGGHCCNIGQSGYQYPWGRKQEQPYPVYNNTLLNPSLKHWGFIRLFDPYTAFQELAMYIGGVLRGPVVEMIQVNDERRLEKHGFDKKLSFRKAPTKKRR